MRMREHNKVKELEPAQRIASNSHRAGLKAASITSLSNTIRRIRIRSNEMMGEGMGKRERHLPWQFKLKHDNLGRPSSWLAMTGGLCPHLRKGKPADSKLHFRFQARIRIRAAITRPTERMQKTVEQLSHHRVRLRS